MILVIYYKKTLAHLLLTGTYDEAFVNIPAVKDGESVEDGSFDFRHEGNGQGWRKTLAHDQSSNL